MRLNQIRPDDDQLRLILEVGFMLRDAGRLDEAEDVFSGMAEFLPRADLPLVALGTVKLRRGQFVDAEALCEKALARCPDSLYAKVHQAEALLFQQRRDAAESELRDIIARDPNSPHSRTALALLDAADLICPTGSG